MGAVRQVSAPLELSAAAYRDAQALPAFVIDGRRYVGRVLGVDDIVAELESLMAMNADTPPSEMTRVMEAIARRMFPPVPRWMFWRRDGYRALMSLPEHVRADVLGNLFFWYTNRIRRALAGRSVR